VSETYLEAERTSAAVGLQRRIGLVIAIASVLLASVSFVYGIWDGIPAWHSFLHPTVVVTIGWALVAAFTAIWPGRLGRVVQVAMITVVMLMAAFTSVTTELTSLLFLGLAIAMAYAYDLFGTQLRYYVTGTAALLIAAISARIRLLGEESMWPVIQWLLGAVFVVALYLVLLKAANQWVTNRHRQLERDVAARTRELIEALDRSEQLRERNGVLLKEVQHRTKNNLQLITSLLSLQQSDPDIESRGVSDVLETTRRRIHAMSTAHELLHSSGRTSTISLKRFLQELTNEFVHSGQVSDVHVDTPTDSDVSVEMDFAAPLGLIITELVANSAEHAVVPDGEHVVWIRLSLEHSRVILTIEDRGTQFPEHISIDQPITTGLQIIAALVSQIRGEISLERSPNTKWIVQAPLPARTEEENLPHFTESR